MASGPAASRPWFAFSLDLAPAAASRHLHGLPPVPDFPEGELAEALDVDVVYDVHVPNWGGRVARLVDAPGHHVTGRLRAVDAESWSVLARLETALALANEERPVRVRTASGDVVEAHAFTPSARNTSTQGPVSEAFLITLAVAAERARLPAAVVEKLQAEARIVHAVQHARPDGHLPQAPHKPGIK
ncbi:gamma-glutamylcyclotransferase [Corallococcus sp. BB11-1]|uniref:gamma-glutamylcyclotransferase family protein n=1 Tax=Corallococcus sp. BB11-1 TaxID=2996783 RepID=UPI00226EEA6C|nr:gamma-glutamylcyclotransferase family protein [Corallococcus sp. BB11-1]MCY1031884.1 gamma-glutamylcyclotransferase [Corallococcus sp. BB11-1]